MKKNRLFFVFATLFVAVAVMFSCQKEEPVVDTMMLKNGEIECTNDVLPDFDNYLLPLCDEECVFDEPFIQGVVSPVVQWGNEVMDGYYSNNKYFTAEVWNDGEKFYVKSTVFGYQYDKENTNTGPGKPVWQLTGPTCDNYPFETVKITINGTEYEISMDDPETLEVLETATEYTAEFLLENLFPDGWSACTDVEYDVRLEGSGPPAELDESETYKLYEACPEECDDAFTLEDVSECGETDRYAEFKFIAGEDGEVKIQGGLTNGASGWTSEVRVNDTNVDELTYGVTADHVHNWIGTLEECDEVVIKIEWDAETEEIIDSWSVARWDEVEGEYVDIPDMETDEVDCE